MHLDPLRATPESIRQARGWINERDLEVVIETGARFVLDPYQKHRPGLCHPDRAARQKRLNLLKRSLEICADLGSGLLNLAAGPRDIDRNESQAWPLLEDGLSELLRRAQTLGVRVSFEPEPGHWIQSLAGYDHLRSLFPELLLTLDVSHVSVCCDEGTPEEAVVTHHQHLGLVHLEDAPRGVHAHLPFGEGELDVSAILRELETVRFSGLCAVELSRHSHSAHQIVPDSLNALKALERELNQSNRVSLSLSNV
jgi:sugar phosphate isomerase/epimerase